MQRFSEIQMRKITILPILALALASMVAACGASTAPGSTNNSRATGTTVNSDTCKFDLSANPISVVSSDIVAGHMRYLFAFDNFGSSPCTLDGYPTVTLDNSAITVTTTTSADTWSNLPIAPITLAPNGGSSAWFVIQGRDETTNCAYVTPSIAPPEVSKGVPSASTLNICGGALYVSPLVSSPQAFNFNH